MPTKRFPEKINDYRVYANGKKDVLGLVDIELPELNSITEEIDGAGILGKYESATLGHYESMQLKLNWRLVTGELAPFLKPDAMSLDIRVANQEYAQANNSYEIIPTRILVKGHVPKNGLGKVAKGGLGEGSSEIEVTYIKMFYNEKVLIEYDRFNYKFVVDGVDVMKPVRKALGL